MKVFPPLHLSFCFREEVEEKFFREELSFQVEDETKVFLFVKQNEKRVKIFLGSGNKEVIEVQSTIFKITNYFNTTMLQIITALALIIIR